MRLYVDFETFSRCELKKEGLDNYAKHESTGIHCMAFAFDDGPVEMWTPGSGDYTSHARRIADFLKGDGLVYAHNAPFELALWNHVLVKKHEWPALDPARVRCTMAMCYAMGLPGALENAAPALGIDERKDAIGKRTMMQLALPKKEGDFYTPTYAPNKFQILYAYCKQDVVVERELHKRLLELSPSEQKVWQLDYLINQRGVRVDLPSIDKALELVESERIRLNQRMLRITGGVVGAASEVQLLVKWIRSQGVKIPGLAKAAVLDALEGELPDNVREALEIRKEAAKSSTAKLVAMKERASSDGFVRNLHQYHGANTGRWAGRGIQVHNFPRPRAFMTPESIVFVLEHLHLPGYVEMLYGPLLDALADSLRGMLIASPGKDFITADFSAVEARVLAWLAGEESVLKVFREHGKIYEHTAAAIYRKPMEKVTKDERQIGKVSVLALGYQGGVGAFQSMAKNYFVKVPDDQAEQIKVAWRESHPAIVRYWYQLEEAAMEAVQTGRKVFAGPKGRQVCFLKKGSFLWCRLPSGRALCYPFPEIREVETPWGDMKDALTYMTVVNDTKGKILEDPASSGKWQRISTYGGSLAENITQAVARDLLAEAMIRLEEKGFPVCMHIHDEVVTEVPEDAPEDTLSKVESIMAEVPAWAEGLPLTAEGWRGKRYRK